MIKNEKIKAAEVELTGLQGEELGVMPTKEALAMAKKLKVDLVCTSLYASPPPCRLVSAGTAVQEEQQAKRRERQPKQKELRLSPQIEEHDYEVKRSQAERILRGGDEVLLVVPCKGKESGMARKLLEELVQDLKTSGRRTTGIQQSGKQAAVVLEPLERK